MPVIKRIPAKQSGSSLQARESYIRDAKHAGDNLHSDKVSFCVAIENGKQKDWTQTVNEMHALEACIETDGAKSEHWVVSAQKKDGEWAIDTAIEAAQTLQKHLGYEGPILIAGHQDTDNSHIHVAFTRIREKADGTYELAFKGGSDSHTQSGHTYAHMSAAKAEAEIRAKQGWSREAKAKFDYIDGKFIKASYPKNPDKINLGSRVEAFESHNNTKHPKRILAEAAVQEIRSSQSNKELAVQRLAAVGIIYTETKNGGKLSTVDVKNGIKLSALPQDCRFLYDKNKVVPQNEPKTPTKISTYNDAKNFVKQLVKEPNTEQSFTQKLMEKGLSFEQTGKTGGRIRFADGPTGTIKLSDCGTSFLKLKKSFDNTPVFSQVPKYNASVNALQEKVHEKSITKSIAQDATPAFQSRMNEAEFTKTLAEQGITLTRETGTDKKTGKEFQYGKLSREGEQSVTLRALGTTEDGKALYSLGKLDQSFLIADAMPILSSTEKEGKTVAAQALQAAGITLSEVTKTIKAEDGQEKAVRYGMLERNGIIVPLGSIAKDNDGKSLYSLGKMEKVERENRQEALRAEAMPIITASAKIGWQEAVKALAQNNIKLSEEPATIKKSDGTTAEVVYARIERDDVSISLKSLQNEQGKPLFYARQLQRQQLATDASKILDGNSSYSSAETALSANGIKSERIRTMMVDKNGDEKVITVLKLEKDGITATSGMAGKSFGINVLDEKFMPQDKAASLYREARTQAEPVKFLAQKGLTASDIDRIGRVGSKIEKGLQRNEKPADAPKPTQAPVQGGRSVIPTNIREILDLIAESAEQAAMLAQANARAAQAAMLARQAENKAAQAEQALKELKSQIRTEIKQPAQAVKEEPKMNSLTPTPTKPTTTTEEKPTTTVETKPLAAQQQETQQQQASKTPETIEQPKKRKLNFSWGDSGSSKKFGPTATTQTPTMKQ